MGEGGGAQIAFIRSTQKLCIKFAHLCIEHVCARQQWVLDRKKFMTMFFLNTNLTEDITFPEKRLSLFSLSLLFQVVFVSELTFSQLSITAEFLFDEANSLQRIVFHILHKIMDIYLAYISFLIPFHNIV